ncbi:hypothetical protein IFM89_012196 [Coptis chinensis]|uniref:Uncharacterized protein n=1 Tax=Coptis chinensis TaxID=261450 RepID=A0A835HLX6_9MAGN|nr:hypothetical protein IFM89_012196 [Coptis chinensis]
MATQNATKTQLNPYPTSTANTSSKRKPVKEKKQKHSSSLANCSSIPNEDQSSIACPYHRSSSLSLSAEFTHATLEATLYQSLLSKEYGSLRENSDLAPSLSQMTTYPLGKGGLANLKARHDRGISWRWLRTRKGIRTKKLINPTGRRSTDGASKRSSKGKCLQDQVLVCEEDTPNKNGQTSENKVSEISSSSNCLSSHNCQSKCSNNSSHEKVQCHSSTSLSSKYQPKLFEDIAGHEILVKALSNAVQKERFAPLYLFHGPSGTGKTSTARIFSMALNCESSTHTKPCWSCRGCTRSLYIMDLCSGSRITGFERIRTLIQSTTFTQIDTGFKVFIIEECHSLTPEAWEEILSIVERAPSSTMVFVMITEDVNMVPKGISSRCQKFCFPKLKGMDIILKLARTVAQEEIEIDREALRLITSKADGSMREAENILDQLALLGSRITSTMVQQIVGLVPHNKLLDLLTTVLSADTIKTVRSTRELIASGVQPKSILSQLASLITDILSGAAATATTSSAGSSKDKRLLRTGSKLTYDQSDRLSSALKMLVKTEKQLSSSSDQTNWIVAALLQIASEHVSNRTPSGIVLPRDIIIPADGKSEAASEHNLIHIPSSGISELFHHRRSRECQHAIDRASEQSGILTNDLSTFSRSNSKTKRCPSRKVKKEPNLGQIGNMEEVWLNVLERIQDGYVKEFLCHQGKIASLTLSSANAIVHLMFKRPEDKLAAQMSEESIANALKEALGCPVTVNMSLEPLGIETDESTSVSNPKRKEKECGYCGQHHEESALFFPAAESQCNQNAEVMMHRSGSRKSSAASESLRPLRLQGDTHISQDKRPSHKKEASTTRLQQILPFSGHLTQGNRIASADSKNEPTPARERNPSTITDTTKDTNPKHRWLSLSSIQQGDASVERYSQDLLFENENNERERAKKRCSKVHKSLIKDNEDQHCQRSTAPMVLKRSWSCSEVFCRRFQ